MLVYERSFSSLFRVSITDRDKKIPVTSFAKRPEKSTFIFASVIFLMFKVTVNNILVFKSTRVYGSLLNDCTFLVIHKVKYCIVLSDFVWMHHLTILRYTWQKRKQYSFSFLHYTASSMYMYLTQSKTWVIFKSIS